MRNIFVFFLVFSFYGCTIIQDADKTNEILKSVSNGVGCPLKFEIESDFDEKKINIKYHCEERNDLYNGKLMLEIFHSLSRKGIFFDRYSICSAYSKNESVFTKKELKSIEKRFEEFRGLLSSLNTSNGSNDNGVLYEKLSGHLKEKVPLDTLNYYIPKIFSNELNYFEGFVVMEFEEEKYLFFKQTNDKHHFLVSYKLQDASDRVIYTLDIM